MNERHGLDAELAGVQRVLQLIVFEPVGLQAQQASDHLQIVVHSMMDFLQQDALFRVGLAEFGDLGLDCEMLAIADHFDRHGATDRRLRNEFG